LTIWSTLGGHEFSDICLILRLLKFSKPLLYILSVLGATEAFISLSTSNLKSSRTVMELVLGIDLHLVPIA
jgi:hypothetical protein